MLQHWQRELENQAVEFITCKGELVDQFELTWTYVLRYLGWHLKISYQGHNNTGEIEKLVDAIRQYAMK